MNTRASSYIQPYAAVPQSQSMSEIYTSSAQYSPGSSPYYLQPGNLLNEHEVKIEGMSHSSPHAIHSIHHHQMLHMTPQHQNHSRSPSVDDERELQHQIVSRNQERPSVVNIKTEWSCQLVCLFVFISAIERNDIFFIGTFF